MGLERSIKLSVLLAWGIATSCVPGAFDKRVTLGRDAARVRLQTSIDPACSQLGDVFGTASVEGDQEAATREARNDLRNRAYAMHATDVLLQTTSSSRKAGMWQPRTEITISGVAYRCPIQAK